MICDEKEIIDKSKEITTKVTYISALMKDASQVLAKATEVGIKDKLIKERLLEMSSDIDKLVGIIDTTGRNLSSELNKFVIEVDNNDNFEFGSEFDSVLKKAVDQLFSL